MYMKKIHTSKYGNKKTNIFGMSFDSKKEAEVYLILKDYERRGRISNLQRQVKYELQPSYKLNGRTEKSINYIADFVYIDNKGKEVIVDVKSEITSKDRVFRIKKKLFEYKYKKEIIEWK